MSGNLLSRPRREGPTDGTQATEAVLEYRQAIEHDVAAKINSTLEPLLGADKFRTGVSADIDMTSGEQSEETFDPSKSVMTSSQKTEDQSGTTRIGRGNPGYRFQSAAAADRASERAANAAGHTSGWHATRTTRSTQWTARSRPRARKRRTTNSSPYRRQYHHHHPALGEHHVSIQPHHQTSEASPGHRQTIVHRGAGGSGIAHGRAGGAGASRCHPPRHREVEGHSNSGGNVGWLGHHPRRSAHRGGASV